MTAATRAEPKDGPGLDRVRAEKRARREEAQARRAAIPAEVRAAAAAAVASAELPFLGREPRIISAYHPFGAELDIMVLVDRLAAAGHRTALPVVIGPGRPLAFRVWFPGVPLESGVRGIPVPPATADEVDPDILLVPLLEFDASGYRLGYGAGYYDRTLTGLREKAEVTAVGVAFAAQEVAKVPIAAHDARLDWILTERGARRIAGGA